MPKGVYVRTKSLAKTYPQELVDKVRLLYGAGKTQAEVAVALGLTQKVIYSLMRRHGLPARPAIKRNQRGRMNTGWKGDQAGYQALHLRVYRARGRPTTCSMCGTTDPTKTYDWANLTGNYQDIADFAPMCRSCHWRYDGRVQNLR